MGAHFKGTRDKSASDGVGVCFAEIQMHEIHRLNGRKWIFFAMSASDE